MAWEENSRICLHMQLIAILSRIGVLNRLCLNGVSLFYLFTFLPLKVPFNHLHPRRQPHLSVVDNELQAGAVGETGGVKTKRK